MNSSRPGGYEGKKEDITMEIYKTRYAADKARKTDPNHSSDERIVLVQGGYALMTEQQYHIWKKQK